MDGLGLCEGEVYVLVVYVETHYCGVLGLGLGYDADRADFNLGDERDHKQDLSVAV